MKQVSSLVVFCILSLTMQAQQIDLPYVMSDAEKQTEVMLKEAAAARKIKPELVSPRTLENGQLKMVASRDWTSGFFPGVLWFLYEYTGKPEWKEKAHAYTAFIEKEKQNAVTHDMGFKVYCSFGTGYRLTNDPKYKAVIMESARTLASRFNPTVGCLRSWDHSKDKWDFPVIIDNMMNLELLFAATELSGDSAYYRIAVSHANTTMKNHFRPDYSSYHVVAYDSLTGKVEKKQTHQGYSHESAWSRGQAWALYGYTMCYRFTRDKKYLEQAEHVAKFILDHPRLPKDKVPYYDFDAPGIPNEPRDASAAACIASGLYELAQYSKKAPVYTAAANTMVESLTKSYRSPIGENKGFLLLHSTGSKPGNSEIDVPLSYADYYYMEALLRSKHMHNKMFALPKPVLKLPAIIASNMVLQQQTNTPLWGSAAPNATIAVQTSWNMKKYTSRADAKGNWKLMVSTPKAGGPYSITISDGKPVMLKNVMIGEVWLCSGQSNMEMPVKGFRNQPILAAEETILEGKNNNIRLFRVERTTALEPVKDVTAEWEVSSPKGVRDFSAVGYGFAKILQQQLDVPVGIIQATWGGTPIQGWMSESNLKEFPESPLPAHRTVINKNHPEVLYNGMIHPLIGFAIKGVLWYQGETNRAEYALYERMMPSMVQRWREGWGKEWAFYYVQLAPYKYPSYAVEAPYMREAQEKAGAQIPNSGMAVCMDAGDSLTIHPANKTVVSRRLAYLALGKTYGVEGISYQNPSFKSMKLVNDTVRIAFDNASNGLTSFGKELNGFEIAGDDQVFHPARAWITNDGVYTLCDRVKMPVAVRYAFRDYIITNLYNTDGLPVAPFRTDNWQPAGKK
ncbi:sialate O-acetylesterase [Pseudobacter ginsenosidimutans]|uniref:Carbohydrate esterase-like sialic acid-specific acetylesterase n=1 Tax=Pseudobacter ginsenosidimutans TaxID=661488 RepID=A0A4Q7MZT6_9BACT|nr:sialate O-acetylesterase [Pseudobacter ginsenosidimutans]RZS74807.1 carbohydrate esterase-like sialic acid-specific acetylesterase [Pseudobacter ginsenosidimutans]